jgi:hypothetical protein
MSIQPILHWIIPLFIEVRTVYLSSQIFAGVLRYFIIIIIFGAFRILLGVVREIGWHFTAWIAFIKGAVVFVSTSVLFMHAMRSLAFSLIPWLPILTLLILISQHLPQGLTYTQKEQYDGEWADDPEDVAHSLGHGRCHQRVRGAGDSSVDRFKEEYLTD